MSYVRLDRVKATAHLESIVATEDLVPGQFLELGALQPDGEARQATPSGDANKRLVFFAPMPMVYDERQNELDYVLKAGKEGRAYVPEEGNIFSVSVDRVVGEPVKGALVAPDAQGFRVLGELDEVPRLHGEIIDTEVDVFAGKLAVVYIHN